MAENPYATIGQAGDEDAITQLLKKLEGQKPKAVNPVIDILGAILSPSAMAKKEAQIAAFKTLQDEVFKGLLEGKAKRILAEKQSKEKQMQEYIGNLATTVWKKQYGYLSTPEIPSQPERLGVPEITGRPRQPLELGTQPAVKGQSARPQRKLSLEEEAKILRGEPISPEIQVLPDEEKKMDEYKRRSLEIREAGLKLRQRAGTDKELLAAIRVYQVAKGKYSQTFNSADEQEMLNSASNVMKVNNRKYPDNPITDYEDLDKKVTETFMGFPYEKTITETVPMGKYGEQSKPQKYTVEQEKTIQENMKFYKKPRIDIINALKQKGIL